MSDETENEEIRTLEGDPGRASAATFFQRGKASTRQMVRESLNYRVLGATPYGFRPVVVLTALGFIGVFDAAIFPLAFPEIVADTGLQVGLVFQIINLAGFIGIFLTLVSAYYADRLRRVPFVGVGSIMGGGFSIVTSFTNAEYTMGGSRIADGIGGVIAGAPSLSLFADYYPVDMRGKVIAVNNLFGYALQPVFPILVAGMVTLWGWRGPFRVTGVLLMLAGLAVFFVLPEPVRGYHERIAVGMSEEEAKIAQEPVTFGEAWRITWSIRTLRRLFIADIPGNAGSFIFSFFFPLYIFQVYGLNINERAFFFGALPAILVLPSALIAGGLVDVLLKLRPERVLILSGVLGVITALFLIPISLAPPLAVVIALNVVAASAGVLLGPAKAALFLQILPAHIRNTGIAVRVLAQIPATILRSVLIGTLISQFGIQGALYLAIPFIFISAVIDLSAASLFNRDLRSALAGEAAAKEHRRAKDEGKAKLLVCRDIDVEYDGVQVLFGVDFDVEEGELIALLGTNGAGKSTLLKAIAGTHQASSGGIIYQGRDVTRMPPHELAPRGVVLMPGGKGIFPNLTVKENMSLGQWMDEEPDAESRLEEVYRIFPILKERGNERAGVLSGGEQQMLSLSQAFLGRPKLLMIDELSLGLAPAVVEQLIEIVKAIHAQGTTVVLVEQSVNVALTVAERAVFMEKGEIRFVGPAEELLTRPDILRAVYVKGTGALSSAPTGGMKTEKELREYELGQARDILEVQNLTKSFGGIKAVNDVSFTLSEGQILGLIGPNGAGKTTVFDLITGYQKPDSGTIIYDGTDITGMSPNERANLRIVRRFQDARLFPSLSVYENILVALDRRMEVKNLALTAFQVPQARAAEKRVRLRADRLLELLDLGAFRDKFVKELSTGLRRITDIACVLAAEPKVLLLDEPSSGIAQSEAEMLGPLLRRVRFETQCSVLIIEHDMPLISSLSDELIAMDQGAVVTRGKPVNVLNDDRVIEAYLGTSEAIIQRSGIRR